MMSNNGTHFNLSDEDKPRSFCEQGKKIAFEEIRCSHTDDEDQVTVAKDQHNEEMAEVDKIEEASSRFLNESNSNVQDVELSLSCSGNTSMLVSTSLTNDKELSEICSSLFLSPEIRNINVSDQSNEETDSYNNISNENLENIFLQNKSLQSSNFKFNNYEFSPKILFEYDRPIFSGELSAKMLSQVHKELNDTIQGINRRLQQIDEEQDPVLSFTSNERKSKELRKLIAPAAVDKQVQTNRLQQEKIKVITSEKEAQTDDQTDVYIVDTISSSNVHVSEDAEEDVGSSKVSIVTIHSTDNDLMNNEIENDIENYGCTIKVVQIMDKMYSMTSLERRNFLQQCASDLSGEEHDAILQFIASIESEIPVKMGFWRKLRTRFHFKRTKRSERSGGLSIFCWRRHRALSTCSASTYPDLDPISSDYKPLDPIPDETSLDLVSDDRPLNPVSDESSLDPVTVIHFNPVTRSDEQVIVC